MIAFGVVPFDWRLHRARSAAAWVVQVGPLFIAGGLKHRRKDMIVDETLIKHMVDRFLGWKLPETFNPDGGVSFTRIANPNTEYQHEYKPVGTNLLSATEADAMVRHMLDGLPQ